MNTFPGIYVGVRFASGMSVFDNYFATTIQGCSTYMQPSQARFYATCKHNMYIIITYTV